MNSPKLVVSPSPHIHCGNNLSRIMLDYIIALVPASVFAIFLFGYPALQVIIIAIASSVAWEFLLRKISKRENTIWDLTAVMNGLLMALVLPPTAPWWLVIVGTLIMVVLGKEVYGGYGNNPFNPVLMSWVILHISYPDYIMDWIVPASNALTDLAPMQVLNQQGPSFTKEYFTHTNLFLGNTPGFIGEVSVLMLLIGGIYLCYRKSINFRLPLSYLAGVFFFSGVFWVFSPGSYADPVFHLFAGGTFLAAFFLTTDMPSSPTTPQGIILFGLGAGILTAIIRMWGAWPFGAFYAVFIMNLFTPFLDKIVPEVYGRY